MNFLRTQLSNPLWNALLNTTRGYLALKHTGADQCLGRALGILRRAPESPNENKANTSPGSTLAVLIREIRNLCLKPVLIILTGRGQV